MAILGHKKEMSNYMKKIDEKELHIVFQKIKANVPVFEELYETYHSLVYQIAFSILKNKEKSEDVMQNVFTKLLNMDVANLPEKNEISWLYKVTKNMAIDYIRKEKKELSTEDIYDITDEYNEINTIIEKETYYKIIDKLNVKEQEIVSLKILGELSFKEIAQILDMPIGSVQWKYYKALHSIKILLGNMAMFVLGATIYTIRKQSMISEENKIKKEENTINNTKQNIEKNQIITESNIPKNQDNQYTEQQ